MEGIVNSFLDVVNGLMCFYILGVVVLRLSMMSWGTHRHAWLLIYALAGVSAAFYLYLLLENIPHIRWPALFGYLHITLWFIESRPRWMTKPPDYMSINCAHLEDGHPLPEDCPLVSVKVEEKRQRLDRRKKPDAGRRVAA